MDIKSILPLIIAGNKNADKVMPLIKMMSENEKNGDKDNSAATQSNKNSDKNDILGKILKERTNPVAAEALQSVLKNAGQKPQLNGITPVLGVVNDDILGKMIKFLNKSH